MATRKQRLMALEQHVAKTTHTSALVMILSATPATDQQAAIDEAKRTHRPILLIHGTPLELDPSLSVVVEVGEYGGSGSPKPDMTPLARSGRWD